eukprot:GFYU01003073.1.p1 GENE.GFYU01003073.1~~GFYU01003073.1.p1  ORF type:complete len:512 (-),score=115.62 GFYU01003073.1:161-1696(-)
MADVIDDGAMEGVPTVTFESFFEELAAAHDYPDTVKDVITWPAPVLVKYLRERCSNSSPSLEDMLTWGPPLGHHPAVNPPEYTFVSHMQDGAAPNKLGDGQIAAIEKVTGQVWLDLTSMYQGIFEGYAYVRHTKPIVERLHTIMLGASAQAIVLSGYETDPMNLKGRCRGLLDGLQRVVNYEWFIDAHKEVCQTPSFPEKVQNVVAALAAAELPVDKYFGRLWCYVERLAITKDKPDYVLNGKGGHGLDALVGALEVVLEDMKRVASHTNFPLDTTITIFQRRMYKRRELKYAVRDVTRMLTQLKTLWGTRASRDAGALDPWSSVQTLDCYCDADRVVVYQIECSIRGVDKNPVDYCACLQLALGKSQLPGEHAMIRESFGRARQIDALTVCEEVDGIVGIPARDRVLCDGQLMFEWLHRAQSAGNVEVRQSFFTLMHVKSFEYFIEHKGGVKRHFKFRRNGITWRIVCVAETSVPGKPVPRLFNPTSNIKPVLEYIDKARTKNALAMPMR